MTTIQQIILNFTIVPVVVAAGIGVVRYRRLNAAQRYLCFLVLASLLIEIAAHTFQYYKQPNLFLAPIDVVLEFTALALLYRHELRPSRLSRLIPWLLGAFVLGSALSYSPRLDTTEFNPAQRFLESLLVLVFVGAFFRREITRSVITRRLEQQPVFWISTAALLYFLSNSLIFVSSNYVLTHSRELSMRIWAIHGLLYIFTYILYGVALAMKAPPAAPGAEAGAGVTQS